MVICPRQRPPWQSLVVTRGARLEYPHAGRSHFPGDYFAARLHQPRQRDSFERHQFSWRSVSTLLLHRHYWRSCPQASLRTTFATTSLELGQIRAPDQHCCALRYDTALVLFALATRAAGYSSQHELGEYYVRRCHALCYCVLRHLGTTCLRGPCHARQERRLIGIMTCLGATMESPQYSDPVTLYPFFQVVKSPCHLRLKPLTDCRRAMKGFKGLDTVAHQWQQCRNHHYISPLIRARLTQWPCYWDSSHHADHRPLSDFGMDLANSEASQIS